MRTSYLWLSLSVLLFSVHSLSAQYVLWLKKPLMRSTYFELQKKNIISSWKSLNRASDMVSVNSHLQRDNLEKALLPYARLRAIEPNFVYYIQNLPNDTEFSKQWGMFNSGQIVSGAQGTAGVDLALLDAWKLTTGSKKIVVAVVDTGIATHHPDLADNIWVNTLEQKGLPGVDDDHNGWVDDIYGYDFYNNRPNGEDDSGHGSHVAGIIGAVTNNIQGVAGVNWHVQMVPIKFSDKFGVGTLDKAIQALDYAAAMKVAVVNAAWGGYSYSQILFEAISRVTAEGALVVAAAGNFGVDNDERPYYPASYKIENVLSVAAIANQGERAKFSNWGAKTVHVAAPGQGIYSTHLNQSYQFLNGTSMASAYGSGVASLILSYLPALTGAELKQRMMQTASPLASMTDITISGGMLNAYSALTQ